VQDLQRKIDNLDTQPTGAAATPGVALSTRPAGSAPTFYAGPVALTLSGFVELMVVERNRNESADWASNFNTSIPYPNSHNYDVSELHFTERQSRIAVLARGPGTAGYASEAYVETDFGGSTTNGNNNQSAASRRGSGTSMPTIRACATAGTCCSARRGPWSRRKKAA